MGIVRVFLGVFFVVGMLFGRITSRANNTDMISVDTVQLDSTSTVYSCGFRTDAGGAKTILLGIRDTAEAGWSSDSMAFIMYLEEGFELGGDKFIWLPSQAHPDSTIFPGGINFPDTIYSVGSTWDACTSCVYAREVLYDTTGIDSMIRTYYSSDYDSVISAHAYAYLARSYAPDFSPWLRLKFVGITGNRFGSAGTEIIVYVVQEGGIVVREKDK